MRMMPALSECRLHVPLTVLWACRNARLGAATVFVQVVTEVWCPTPRLACVGHAAVTREGARKQLRRDVRHRPVSSHTATAARLWSRRRVTGLCAGAANADRRASSRARRAAASQLSRRSVALACSTVRQPAHTAGAGRWVCVVSSPHATVVHAGTPPGALPPPAVELRPHAAVGPEKHGPMPSALSRPHHLRHLRPVALPVQLCPSRLPMPGAACDRGANDPRHHAGRRCVILRTVRQQRSTVCCRVCVFQSGGDRPANSCGADRSCDHVNHVSHATCAWGWPRRYHVG